MLCAEFLEANYDQVFTHYQQLLSSENYVTRRQSLKLLGELLLDRHNFTVSSHFRHAYICSVSYKSVSVCNLSFQMGRRFLVEKFISIFNLTLLFSHFYR